MDRDWRRLGGYIQRRRADLHPLTQAEAAVRGEVSLAVWGQLERGEAENPKRSSLRAVDRALGWEQGSAERIAEGGEPVLSRPEAPGGDQGAPSLAGPSVDIALQETLIDVLAALEAMRAVLDDIARRQSELAESQRIVLGELRRPPGGNAPRRRSGGASR